MPVWRCPHCATPQAETSRCWVCRRSTTSCVTCRHYRRGISGGLGLCGLDPRHAPVADTDVRACWVDAAPATGDATEDAGPRGAQAGRRGAPADRPGPSGGRVPRTFVPVETLTVPRHLASVAVLERAAEAPPATDPAPGPFAADEPVRAPAPAVPAGRSIPGRWWLWGDPDPWPERRGERWI